jgi:hypothetical protein
LNGLISSHGNNGEGDGGGGSGGSIYIDTVDIVGAGSLSVILAPEPSVPTPDPGSELPPSTLINPLLATWRVGASMYKFLAFISPPYLTLSTSSTFMVAKEEVEVVLPS